MLTLCTLARLTVVPSNSTGSNTATGLISPVLEALHSTSSNTVSAISSAHLKAIAFRGNLAVLPKLSPYAISSIRSTRPSDGKSLVTIFSANSATAAGNVSPVTRTYSTTVNPCSCKNLNLFSCESLKSTPSAVTSEKAKKFTCLLFVTRLSSWRTEPLHKLRGFLYCSSTGRDSLISRNLEYVITASPRSTNSP